MKNYREKLKRLDIQLGLVIGGIVVLWFVSVIVSANILNKERIEKNSTYEKERIKVKIAQEQPNILNDLLLDQKKSLEFTLKDIYQYLGLSFIEISTKGNTLIRIGNSKVDKSRYLLELKFPILFDGKEYGVVSLGKELFVLNNTVAVPYSWLVLFTLLILGVLYLLKLFIQKQVLNPIVEKEKQAALGELAAQVAHDIRSPLMALSVVNENLEGLSTSKRELINGAVNRIREIAESLLNRNKKTENRKEEKIAELVEELITEKKIQYSAREDIKISSKIKENTENRQAKIESSSFKRVLSNLIDNSIEAIEMNGEVRVLVSEENNSIKLQVTDNGTGLDSDALEKLFEKGVSFKKSSGYGLGLYHAKNTVESWGGSITIDSVLNVGTSVNITLPIADSFCLSN